MYDSIVIGAGPGGSAAATTIAQAGYKVLILEKNSTCRSPCAGYISGTINIELPESCIVQSRITAMRTYLPDLSFHDFKLNGFVVDRPSFDTALLIKAKEAGAEVRWDSPLIDFAAGGVKFRGGEAKGKIIIGADGVFSKTASLLGLDKQRIAVCAQYHLKGIKPTRNTAEIFFNNDYAPGGYVWVYPTGEDSAKVGVGVTRSRSPRQCLDAFISECLNGVSKTGYITGALPVGGLREKLCIGNVLLVGDSAGMADPVTGAGINNAMLAGESTGKTAIDALESGDMEMLALYETRVKRLLAKPLGRALGKRKQLEECFSNELLQQHLPELWVTFKQYWMGL